MNEKYSPRKLSVVRYIYSLHLSFRARVCVAYGFDESEVVVVVVVVASAHIASVVVLVTAVVFIDAAGDDGDDDG